MLPKIEKYPVWVNVVLAVFRAWLYIYDCLVYIPFQIFASPKEKLRRSERIKAKPLIENDPGSPWRNVDCFDKLKDQLFEGTPTLDQLWERSTIFYGTLPCMGTREVFGVEQEKQPSGKVFEKWQMGEYQWQTYLEVHERVMSIGSGLLAIGHETNQHCVIFAETRAEWMMTALACFRFRFPVVTVYATLGEEAMAHAINESEAETIVTTQELAEKVAKILPHCKAVRRMVYFESHVPDTPPAKYDEKMLPKGFKVYSLTELEDIGLEKDLEPEEEVQPDDIAVIMYTSGTTGLPKGVLISHANLVAANTGQAEKIPELGSDDVYVAYLPLAHVLELSAEFACLAHGVRVGYSSALTLTDQSSKIKRGCKGDLTVLQPTFLAAVPSIFDRIYKTVIDRVEHSSPLRQALFHCMYGRKRAKLQSGYDNPFLNRLIFSHIRAILGGRVRLMLCGGAPLSAETQQFLNICFCCPVGQGYGLTETCGAGTIADPEDLTTGRVGAPLICNDIMLRDWPEANYRTTNKPYPQGEILISGANVVRGYYKNDAKTREDFIELNDKRRWFCTGDIGEYQPDGVMRIIDRKKDLVKLQHGEYISLANVETALLTVPLVDNICVWGNSASNALVALVVPNRKNLQELAAKNGVCDGASKTVDFTALCRNAKVIAAVQTQIEKYGKERKLEKFEIPASIYLCEEIWTPDSGLLTEAMKLKRKPIEEKYKKVLLEMSSKL